jgi:S1-C subfamily serine protease
VTGPPDPAGTTDAAQARVLGKWASFALQSAPATRQCIPATPDVLIAALVLRLGGRSELGSLEVEWAQMPLATAGKLDLPDEWVRRYDAHNPQRREVLTVTMTVAGTPAASFFRSGDILLSIDGAPANTFREVERAAQKPAVEVVVFRDGQEVAGTVETVALDGLGIDRVVSWAGALLQEPHRELAAQRGIESGGVYVAYFNYGSPASRFGLFAGRRIVAVNGRPTPDLDSFVTIASGLAEGESVRLDTVSWNEVPEVLTLTLDPQYWPSYELRREGLEWQRYALN